VIFKVLDNGYSQWCIVAPIKQPPFKFQSAAHHIGNLIPAPKGRKHQKFGYITFFSTSCCIFFPVENVHVNKRYVTNLKFGDMQNQWYINWTAVILMNL
jgi:hypothetical protein